MSYFVFLQRLTIFTYFLFRNTACWNEDDSKNIESLVFKIKNEKRMDNAKLLLDVIPRFALGYEFTFKKVNIQSKICAIK